MEIGVKIIGNKIRMDFVQSDDGWLLSLQWHHLPNSSLVSSNSTLISFTVHNCVGFAVLQCSRDCMTAGWCLV